MLIRLAKILLFFLRMLQQVLFVTFSKIVKKARYVVPWPLFFKIKPNLRLFTIFASEKTELLCSYVMQPWPLDNANFVVFGRLNIAHAHNKIPFWQQI